MKESRHQKILEVLDADGVVSVKDLKVLLDVTDMTIRRDLIELEEAGLLTRVHGGAHRRNQQSFQEASHTDKTSLMVEEKKLIAQKCAQLIQDGDTVFIGAGTTTGYIAQYLEGKAVSIVTNSLPIFETLKDQSKLDLILIGGRYRMKTQTFVGQFANKLLKDLKVSKAFIGVNGIDGHNVTTANEEEGNGNAIILHNANQKYIVADHSKLNCYSFYTFFHLDDVDAIITDEGLPLELYEKYSRYTKLL